ncbi:dTDP-4-dehydrorhamnose 3,5-epimerase [Pseudobacter ginsenosidimutans]|uniref:dTDP-4-dehydrorhamnose 3,5-epimerase n=1 Tax=Pseudobacter ginsenosidimutans TaxID=661488 RepID=A0A4Q7ML43_9BACT|nr:dTDP-4-dehydrorhamnose 3,5-epimerase [Pseudobacter ginsenosidimutans]QEC40321.1 dTDP-4-dehydrorhamnose 3,5-epimerase [Pseudobacter ginsenosidimutans]RZS69075.1 dTDP-4-dehydrorhamnose 3,5-epimerase [Pseudobacter ginsenosidimutans]
MPFIETDFPGLIIFEPAVFEDNRGYFFESYNDKVFEQMEIGPFLQDNQSHSKYGVIRGLHYQLAPHAQAKLVRVLSGTIQDIAVDIRKGSPTFGKVFSIELSAENKKQLYIPGGFAHGFSVLSETADVLYKCDTFYNKEAEGGIIYNDPSLNIDWKIPADKVIVSPKDLLNSSFAECLNNFEFHA